MQTITTGALELTETWIDGDPSHSVRVDFPINRSTGAESSSVVYFEVAPGKRLATHTDSAEEILYIVSGTAEAQVGDERGIVHAGDLAVVPEMVPHGLVNVGDEPVRVVGFFSHEAIVSTF